MTLKYAPLSGFVVLACLVGYVALRTCHHGGDATPNPVSVPAGNNAHEPHVPGFQLTDTDGHDVALADFEAKLAIAVVFIGAECPLANLYVLRLASLQREYGPRGLQVIAINSNSQDSPKAVAQHARDRRLPFPVLLDPGHKVADLFGASRTPEAFLVDASGQVHYRGRIDDQYGVGADRRAPTRHDLREAIEDVLAGKAVRVAQTPLAGCYIGREPAVATTPKVTFTQDVAPILQKHCQECHRPGQVAPFSLLTYGQASRWSRTIAEVVRDGRMPPWHADPRHGEFANDRRLPETDRQALLAWVKQGCPKGDDNDLPPAQAFPKGWAIGAPDLVLTMKESFTVPAEAPTKGIDYQRFTLATGFPEDVWVQAVEARPGNRAVVHHMLAYIGDKPADDEGQSGDRDVLVGYVPGSRPAILPPGLARRIPKGFKIVLEMHYTANGTAQVDRSAIALVFAKSPPEHQVRSRFIANRQFAIPPRAASHAVTAATTFDKEALLLSLTPHMHLRGKSFLFRAVYPDARTEILLAVPRYDFNWQHTYALKKPLHVPAGTRIECVGVFDNSAANPNNPDPMKEVRWGEQSWEEMMLGVVGYIYVQEPSAIGVQSAKR